MSNQSESFSWIAPAALERVAGDVVEASRHPEVLRALRALATKLGLDPETVRVTGVKLGSGGNTVMASARRV